MTHEEGTPVTPTSLDRFRTFLSPINLVARVMKWVIAVTAVIALLLYLPDQVRELYRITATAPLRETVYLTLWIATIGLAIWWAARQTALEAQARLGGVSKNAEHILRLIPVILGCTPLIAAACAQPLSIPEPPNTTDEMSRVGSIIIRLTQDIGANKACLWFTFGLLLATGVALALSTWLVSLRTDKISNTANRRYLSNPLSLLITLALIAAMTAAFVLKPVSLPQSLTTIGIIAIFTIAVSVFVVHVTLLTARYDFPIMPAIFVLAAIFAMAGSNDNHSIRPLPSAAVTTNNPLPDVAESFVQWVNRDDRLAYVKGLEKPILPVFVVAAQGGGAYAAYNAAVFLARMQDVCPNFRHHLFAISSVSGGSVGAATFATALDAEDKAHPSQNAKIGPYDPCPQITQYLDKERPVKGLDTAGPIERHVTHILRSDFLSPLVAATLFPDFSQIFLPMPIPAFDRARALEYAFEASASNYHSKPNSTNAPASLAEANFFDIWSAQNSMPALLMNATDAGTGKKAVIAPFRIASSQSFSEDVCLFARSGNKTKPELEARPTPDAAYPIPLRLSTAAFISARFPWISPAATVNDVDNPCFGKKGAVRLVDGGYLDNSGVETAVVLVERLRQVVKDAKAKNPNFPDVGIHLISLTGGDFPVRSSYSFGDVMEPIRALLSSRESRSYIALKRGTAALSTEDNSTASSFNQSDLRNMFYRLPLGWSLSNRTRNVIADESGRYWDCEPDLRYKQKLKYLSNADCIQLKINVLLKGSLPEAIANLRKAEKYRADFDTPAKPKLDAESILACYERDYNARNSRQEKPSTLQTTVARFGLKYQQHFLDNYQAEQVRAILREWDAVKDRENDPRVLAFILASLSHDTLDFRRTSEFLTFTSVEALNAIWGPALDKADDTRKKMKPPQEAIDRTKLINNPKKLAETAWTNRFRNRDATDAWNFRPRGLIQIVGRDQYEKFGPLIKYDLVNNPDAVYDRRAAARIAFEYFLSVKKPVTKESIGDFLKQTTPRWEDARLIDSDQPQEHPKIVARKSEMFLECINAAALKN